MTNSNKKLIYKYSELMKEQQRFKAENQLFYAIVGLSPYITMDHYHKAKKMLNWEVDLDERIEKMKEELHKNNIGLGYPTTGNTLENWLLNLGFKTVSPLTPCLCTAISCYYDTCDYHDISDAEPYPSKSIASAVIHRLKVKGWNLLDLSDDYIMNQFYEDLVDACYYYDYMQEDDNEKSYEEINEQRKFTAKYGEAFLNSIVLEADEEESQKEDAVYDEVRKNLIKEGFLLNNEQSGFISMPLCGSEDVKIMCIKDGSDFEVALVTSLPHVLVFDSLSKNKKRINNQLEYPVVWMEDFKTIVHKVAEDDKMLVYKPAKAIKDIYRVARPMIAETMNMNNFRIIK